jgi:protein Tex
MTPDSALRIARQIATEIAPAPIRWRRPWRCWTGARRCPSSRATARRRRAGWTTRSCAPWPNGWPICASWRRGAGDPGSIREQGKLTDDLAARIAKAVTKAELEDIYLPYKPKRRTKAMIARENGLEPLAEAILADRAPIRGAGGGFLTEGAVPTCQGRAGRRARHPGRRAGRECRPAGPPARPSCAPSAFWSAKVVEGKEAEGAKFSDYFAHSEPWATAPATGALAMLRARNEGSS